MKNLAELQSECERLGIEVTTSGRASKEPYVAALREYRWRAEYGQEPMPQQIHPMLLSDWQDLNEQAREQIEHDDSGWVVQEKKDGVRALVHVRGGKVRITGRCVSEVNYRLADFQDNLPNLIEAFQPLADTVLDGELVCPVGAVDTGECTAADPLHAAIAIMSAGPEKAIAIQQRQPEARLQFHAFDVLRHLGQDHTDLSLSERQRDLAEVCEQIDSRHVHVVPSYATDKAEWHRRVIGAGGEGTVWKKADERYETGRRVWHWVKRKATVEVEAFVSGFKPGTAGRGHSHLIGAVEFSTQLPDGTAKAVAWVSAWSDDERQAMTEAQGGGTITLSPAFRDRRALITGLDLSAKSQRVRHARLVRWM